MLLFVASQYDEEPKRNREEVHELIAQDEAEERARGHKEAIYYCWQSYLRTDF